ncbi:MAG: FHA domain-containing protein [Proteobacteria bacterium]|nr:FHA domain-containing protein [Pseudomonadota bacterium]
MTTADTRQVRGAVALAVGAAALLCTLSPSSFAQDPPAAPPADPAATVTTVDVSRVVATPNSLTAYVSVRTAARKPAEGLTAASFGVSSPSVEAVGSPLAIADARQVRDTGEGIAVAMVVDTSCSMRDSMHRVRNAASWYAHQTVEGQDWTTIVTFDDVVRGLEAPWTAKRGELDQRIDGLSVPYGTRTTVLYEALGRTTSLLGEDDVLPPMRAVLVLGDGIDEGSKDPFTSDYIQGLAQKTAIPFFSVWFEPGASAAEGHGLETMRALSAASHGDTVEAYGPILEGQDPVVQAFQQFHETAHGVYRLELRGTGALPAGEYAATVSVATPTGPLHRSFRFEIPSPGVVFPTAVPAAATTDEAEDEEGLSQKGLIGWVVLGIGAVGFVLIAIILIIWTRPKKVRRDSSGTSMRMPSPRTAPSSGERGPTLVETEAGPPMVGQGPSVGGPGVDFGSRGSGVPTPPAVSPPTPPSAPAAPVSPSVPRGRSKTMVMDGRSWWIDVVDGADAGRHFIVHPGRMHRLGAAEGSDILLTDGTVSSYHADVEATDAGIRVHDRGSTNGTFLGTVRQAQPFDVAPGADLAFGRCRVSIRAAQA